MSVKGHSGPGAPAGEPHAKSTEEEEEIRLTFVIRLLAEGRRKSEIKKMTAKAFGLAPRSVERYLGLAKEHLREAIGKSREEIRMTAYAMYQTVIQDPKASTTEKLRAQENIVKLTGAAVPQGHEIILPASARTTDDSTDSPKDPSKAIGAIRTLYGLQGGRSEEKPATGTEEQRA